VVWWREWLPSDKGHVGLVHKLSDGSLYAIEESKSPSLQGFRTSSVAWTGYWVSAMCLTDKRGGPHEFTHN